MGIALIYLAYGFRWRKPDPVSLFGDLPGSRIFQMVRRQAGQGVLICSGLASHHQAS